MKKTILVLFLTFVALCPGSPLMADDTDIFGGASISVEPNILIIFDTSGSMDTKDVMSDPYDPNTTYPGSFATNAVYWWDEEEAEAWVIFANDVNDIVCPEIKEDLLTEGKARGYIRSRSYTCGGGDDRKRLRTGNYRNYDRSSGGTMRKRIDVAKEAVTKLLRDTDGVRFGLMRFNHNTGGRVIKPIKSVSSDEAYRTELINTVNGLPTDCWTPLAETLSEAGLYFAGKKSWFNKSDSYSDDILTGSSTYTSPMQYRCQKNYIILMTDGEPTKDLDSKLKSGSYINGDKIGDYDGDGIDPGPEGDNEGSDYLDDVAKYLNVNDCNPSLGTGDPDFEKQNIVTYTIGFKSDQKLLKETAHNGGGKYFQANSISALTDAFETIIDDILKVNQIFVTPSVPISKMNGMFNGDMMYVGFFQPQTSGRWAGNVKKYKLEDGKVLDRHNLEATDANGKIKDSAVSYWSATADGPAVTSGGCGGLLQINASRKLYTHLSTTFKDLTISENAFSIDNALLTPEKLGVSSPTERDAVIKSIHGSGSVDDEWIMGDVLHSQPSVVHYDTNGDGEADDSYIFVGTNGGIMHAFDDSSGKELWGFVPTPQLGRLKQLSDNVSNHDYFVDGTPFVYNTNSIYDKRKILFFGERRGGSNYYALDISNPAVPKFKYSVGDGILGATAPLGQSWSDPTVHKIKTGPGLDAYRKVFLLAGGYDENQDLDAPAPTDSVGKSVFTIDADTGTLTGLNMNAGNFAAMTHCIVSAMGFDSIGDTFTNRVYAGDLGGNIWAFEDDNPEKADFDTGGDGNWNGRLLFSAGGNRKIFYAPDAVLAKGGKDIIFFGTGDRAAPKKTSVENAVYVVRNDWEEGAAPLTEANLVNLTAEEGAEDLLKEHPGWFIKLKNPGEKIISSVVVYSGGLYFTTYTPDAAAPATPVADPCKSEAARGVARLYAVCIWTGKAVLNFNTANDSPTGGEVLTIADRSLVIGSGIPSAPMIAIGKKGAIGKVSSDGNVTTFRPRTKIDMFNFYWRRASN